MYTDTVSSRETQTAAEREKKKLMEGGDMKKKKLPTSKFFKLFFVRYCTILCIQYIRTYIYIYIYIMYVCMLFCMCAEFMFCRKLCMVVQRGNARFWLGATTRMAGPDALQDESLENITHHVRNIHGELV